MKTSVIMSSLLTLTLPTILFAEPPSEITLFLQGYGPEITESAAEESWGRLTVDRDAQFLWTGLVGDLIHQHNWKFGGILRSQSATVTWGNLDARGAAADSGDFYVLASSVVSQQLGLESRAQEIATAVQSLHNATNARVRLVCYSASGVCARMWLQGALPTMPYQRGLVSEVITIATPHQGIGGWVRPAGHLIERYRPLLRGSELLRRLNDELDLPTDVRFKSIVLQSDRLENRAEIPVSRYAGCCTADELQGLPEVLRLGHDGVIDTLSAQLHLTRTAARYEQTVGHPVNVAVCLLNEPESSNLRELSLHTQCLSDSDFREFLYQELTSSRSQRQTQEQWCRRIAEFSARTDLRDRQPNCRPVSCAVELKELDWQSKDKFRASWSATVDAIRSRLLKSDTQVELRDSGNLTVQFDRHARPIAVK